MSGSKRTKRTGPAGYGWAALISASAVILRWTLTPIIGVQVPFFTVYLGVLIATRYFGLGPALFVTAAGGFGSALVTGEHHLVRLALYIGVCGVSIWLVEVLRRAGRRAEQAAQLAAERLESLKREAAQRAHEEVVSAQLRAIVESSDDAIVSKDLDGVIRSWNHAAEQIFGYEAAEVIGRPISLIVPQDRLREESEILETIRHGGHVKHFETLRKRKDGRQIHVALTVSPVYDERGEIAGASHIARDITDRLEFEEQLRQTQKLESLGVLAGGLAHDFNNLLTGIVGNASLTLDDLPQGHRARTRIQEIMQASERAALLIRQMLAYAGKGNFIVEPLDMSEQVSEIAPLLQSSIPRTVDLRMNLESGLPPVHADASQVQQLIMNLAINAAEAMDGESGTVIISTSARRTEQGAQVVLEVRDTGTGMDSATRARIFDPFFTTKFTGRGLGLAAVMGIVRACDGSISVESTPGAGSTFTVVLPARELARKPVRQESVVDLRGYGRVLVIDHEVVIRGLAQSGLEQYGYLVDVAGESAGGLALFRRAPESYAAVLLDLTVPVNEWEQTLREIRNIRPDVPALLSSSYSETEAFSRFGSGQHVAFLQKPYTIPTLARRLKQLIHESGARTGDRDVDRGASPKARSSQAANVPPASADATSGAEPI